MLDLHSLGACYAVPPRTPSKAYGCTEELDMVAERRDSTLCLPHRMHRLQIASQGSRNLPHREMVF